MSPKSLPSLVAEHARELIAQTDHDIFSVVGFEIQIGGSLQLDRSGHPSAEAFEDNRGE